MSYRSSILMVSLTALVTILISCSDNPAIRLRYDAEKMLFDAEATVSQVQGLSSGLTSGQLQQIYPAFHECIEFCYRALDSIGAQKYPVERRELIYLTYKSSIRLSELFFLAKQYDSSVAIVNRLMDNVELNDNQLLPSYLNLGQALQASGSWDSALVVFNLVIDQFYPPVNNRGDLVYPAFRLPIHLYRVSKAFGDSSGETRELARAEQYYRKVTGDFPDSRLSSAAHLALADLYNESRQWDKEIEELTILADSTQPTYRDILLRMADAYGGGMRRFDTAFTIYSRLLNKLSDGDTTGMAPEILFRMGLLRMEQKDYDETRSIMARLKKDYPKYYDTVPMPQYTLARSLELDGKWERAESEYALLVKKYPGSDEAMMAMLYMIDNLRSKGRTAEADTWYLEAEKTCDEMGQKGRGTLLEARAMFYRAELLRRKADYAGAAEILLALFNKFPDTEPGQRAIIAAAGLYRDNLRDFSTADSLLSLRQRYIPNLVQAGSK